MPNILILSQWYFPDTWMQLRDLAARLKGDGYGVEVLSAVPYSLSDGKIVPGYKVRFRQTEILDGIKVVRLPLYISQSRSGLGRILCYTSFGISAATIGQFGLQKPDIVFCYNLPTLDWAARLFRFFRGSKTVLMVQDLWPESVTNSGMMKNQCLGSILKCWCRRFYRRADALTGLSPGFKEKLTERGVDPARIEVVYNWTDENAPLVARPENLEVESSPKRKISILYAGNMGVYQGLDTVLHAASILEKRRIPASFRLIGGGVEQDRLKNLASELNLTNVQFAERVSSDKIGVEFARADALLVHLKKLEMFKVTVPGKTQAYLYAGKPILCGVEGEVAHIVRKAEAGFLFEPENPHSLVDAVEKLVSFSPEQLRQMGESGRRFYKTEMSFETGYQRITDLFDRLLSKKSPMNPFQKENGHDLS